MAFAFHGKHLHLGVYHRFWLIAAAMIAFLLVALWTQPVN